MKKFNPLLLILLVLFATACGNTTSSNQSKNTSKNASSSSNTSNQEKYVLSVSHGYTTAQFQHTFAVWYGQEIEKRSNGRLSLEIYPNGQLMPVNQEVAGLLQGQVDMIQSTSPVLSNFDPIWNFYDLPFLFEYDTKDPLVHLENMTAFNLHENGGKFIEKRMEEKGIKVLGMSYNDYFGSVFTADKDILIKNMESFKGLKIRTPGGIITPQTLKALGSSGITISGTEAITALQQGVVDGILTTPMYVYDAKLPVKTYSVIPIFTSATPLLISMEKFNSLPKDLQDILLEVGSEYPHHVKDVVYKSYVDKIGKLETELGVEIYYPTKEEIHEMREATKSVWDFFVKEVDGGKQLIEVLESINN
jgi:TRAP-type C4-dicarboxylate transport system substrate-binding protein